MSIISYIWPVNERPTFAWGHYPSGAYHPAYDLPSPTGTAVHAPAAGTVIFAGWDTTGYGNAVFIRHATGHMSILAHNESLLVRVGQVVKQGQQVSISDSTGLSSGPHVHWETRYSVTGLQRVTAYDPGPYIGAGREFTGPDADPTPGPTSGAAWYGSTSGVRIAARTPTLTGSSVSTDPLFVPVRVVF